MNDLLKNLNEGYSYANHKITFFYEPRYLPKQGKLNIIKKGFDILTELLNNYHGQFKELLSNDCYYLKLKDRGVRIYQWMEQQKIKYEKRQRKTTKNIEPEQKLYRFKKPSDYKSMSLNNDILLDSENVNELNTNIDIDNNESLRKLIYFNLILCKNILEHAINSNDRIEYNSDFMKDKMYFLKGVINELKPYKQFIERLKENNETQSYHFLRDSVFDYICAEKGIVQIFSDFHESHCQKDIFDPFFDDYPQMNVINRLSDWQEEDIGVSILKGLSCDTRQNEIYYYNTSIPRQKIIFDKTEMIKQYIIYLIYRKTYNHNLMDDPMLTKNLENIIKFTISKYEKYLETYLEMSGLVEYVKPKQIFNIFDRLDYFLIYHLNNLFQENNYREINSLINLFSLKYFRILKIVYDNAYDTEIMIYGMYRIYSENNINVVTSSDIMKVNLVMNSNILGSSLFYKYLDWDNKTEKELMYQKYYFMEHSILKQYLCYGCTIEKYVSISIDNLSRHQYLHEFIKIGSDDYPYDDKLLKYNSEHISPNVEKWLVDVISMNKNDSSNKLLFDESIRDKYLFCTKDYAIFPDRKWEIFNLGIRSNPGKIKSILEKYTSKFSDPYFIAYHMSEELKKYANLCNQTNTVIPPDQIKKSYDYLHSIKNLKKKDIQPLKELMINTIIFMYEKFGVTYDQVHTMVHYMADILTGTFHVHFITLYKENLYTGSKFINFHKSDTYDKQFRSIKLVDIINNLEIAKDDDYYNTYQGFVISYPRNYELMALIDKYI